MIELMKFVLEFLFPFIGGLVIGALWHREISNKVIARLMYERLHGSFVISTQNDSVRLPSLNVGEVVTIVNTGENGLHIIQ